MSDRVSASIGLLIAALVFTSALPWPHRLAAVGFPAVLAHATGQDPGVLHIKVVLVDPGNQPSPVPRHALLISENPASAVPRVIVTRQDGTADVRLRAGNYTVESDSPAVFHGNAYRWRQTVDIVSGRDAVMELTAGNAEVEPATSAATGSASPPESDPSFLLSEWRDSVVAVWSATSRGSGFLIGATGLIATNQRAVGSDTSVEVQVTPAVKVEAAVVAADPVLDVAILRVNPGVVASVRPIPLPCDRTVPLVQGQEILTISVPLRQPGKMSFATVVRVDASGIVSDFSLAFGGAGGPVFTANGDVAGITSFAGEDDTPNREDPRIVRVEDVCRAAAAAEKAIADAAPPGGTHLPVEPPRPFPLDALEDTAKGLTGVPSAYQMSSSTFDVAFITPVQTYAAVYQSRHGRPRTTSKDTRTLEPESPLVRTLLDFNNWSEYVEDFPPVLLVRVTPKLVEGFWTKVARGAAQAAGVGIPPIKRLTSGFSRLRALCGEAEVTPIHPFKLEHRIPDTDTIHEGLYVFDPGALGPHCGTVKLVLYSEKEPDKADTRVVDPGIVERMWRDFAPYRSTAR